MEVGLLMMLAARRQGDYKEGPLSTMTSRADDDLHAGDARH